MAKIVNVNGCLCYLQKASSVNKSNRKIYKNQKASEKAQRQETKFFESLPKTAHKRQRVFHLHRKGLI